MRLLFYADENQLKRHTVFCFSSFSSVEDFKHAQKIYIKTVNMRNKLFHLLRCKYAPFTEKMTNNEMNQSQFVYISFFHQNYYKYRQAKFANVCSIS